MRRLEAMFVNIRRIHFVGIGGIGMSGIAEVLLTLGFEVSGSDLKHSAITERLVELGATVREGHSPENVAGAEVVVTSSAISPDNPEVAEAKRLHIPVIQRAEMLAELMRLKYGIAVAGMHGKTTTTSMIASVLFAGGLDPTVVVGGRVDALGSNARFGKSHYLVAEADESDRSFLKLAPIVAVITNLDKEHMDCYRDMADIEQTFVEFADRVPFYGMVVVCNDDDRLRALLPGIARRSITYGLRADSDFRILDAESELDPNSPQPMSRFSVSYRGKSLGDFHLHVPGRHNVLNAAAAVAVGVGLEIDTNLIRLALENFRGVDRRFQVRGKAAGVTVVDDYGHHPTEIRATLAAARQLGFRKVHVVFQPHRFTRTQALLDDFGRAFADADSVFLLDIYPASEKPIPGVTATSVVERIVASGQRSATYACSFDDAIKACTRAAADGDMILTLGAGNVSQLGPQILEKLAAREGISATAG